MHTLTCRPGTFAVFAATILFVALATPIWLTAQVEQEQATNQTNLATLTTLVKFDGANGMLPFNAPLVQGLDGNFYGTTWRGGSNSSNGTVFRITPAGKLTTIYDFCSQTNCSDGNNPVAGLVLATDGNFYGTTSGGGTGSSNGTVFRITPAGKLTTIYDFCSQTNCSDGWGPYATLVQATDGNFYGTTYQGGVYNMGTVFKITPEGTLTTLYSFCHDYPYCTDGQDPYAGVVQATDGNLYGTTTVGGTRGNGTVFKITPQGTLTTLHRFTLSDGSEPMGGLVQASDGNFYGMTTYGGANKIGTVFKITREGTLTTLYSFCSQTNCTDGELPQYEGLVQATDGNFYGPTSYGGINTNGGTVFKITPGGILTTLYNFCTQTDCLDGESPTAGLVQATNGNFYGTTQGNFLGNSCSGADCGTVFSLSVGLLPFVETLPTSGKVGAAVIILGNNLKGTTSVTFNGMSAAFTVVSSTEIKTVVPKGATTGKVKVKTPSRTMASNVNFRVTP